MNNNFTIERLDPFKIRTKLARNKIDLNDETTKNRWPNSCNLEIHSYFFLKPEIGLVFLALCNS